MKKIINTVALMAACLAIVAACKKDKPEEPKTDPVEQTANTWVFNDGDEAKAGSVLICVSSGNITAYFSAKEGLSTVKELRGADDCTEITFPAAAVGSGIDLAALNSADAVTRILSKRPEFGEKDGFLIAGGSNSISEGKLSSKSVGGTIEIKCEFTTLGKNIRFSVYLQGELQHDTDTGFEGNYYKYGDKTVELKSVYAASAGEDGLYFGIIASPDANKDLDDIMEGDSFLYLTVDEASLNGSSVFDPLTGKSVFNLTAPLETELEMTLLTDGHYIGFPEDPVNKGTITVYFSGDTKSGRVMNAEGDITFTDGKTLKFSCSAPLIEQEEEKPTYGQMKYYVQSANIYEAGTFASGFFIENTWDEGMTFTYSLSPAKNYIALGGNAYVEIYIGSEQLLNGKPFDIAKTPHPFSFEFYYLDRENITLVPVYIDNNNRAGASGSVSFKKNSDGLYDAEFNVSFNNGDINVKGDWSGELKSRNVIYTTADGPVATIRSATLDISGDPCLLYLSTKEGTAGPDQYDIIGEVPANEWRYNYYMAFGSCWSAITWIDGVRYDIDATDTTPVLGGNWRVMTPKAIPGGFASECKVMVIDLGNAYYYGEIKVIE